jgi:hypothetical protein
MGWIAIAAEGLAGLGTLLLAFFTWRLARTTRLDVEAQWRPLLVPCKIEQPSRWADLTDDGEFVFGVENVGKGAALGVIGSVADPPHDGGYAYLACDPLSSPVVAVGSRVAFRRPRAAIAENKMRVSVGYEDLAGNPHHTQAVYRRINDNQTWRVESVDAGPKFVTRREMAVSNLLWRLRAPVRGLRSVVRWVTRKRDGGA